MILVRVGEHEYVPHLSEGGKIHLQGLDTYSKSLRDDSIVMYKAVGENTGWRVTNNQGLLSLLEKEASEVDMLRRRVLSGEIIRDLNYLAEVNFEVTI